MKTIDNIIFISLCAAAVIACSKQEAAPDTHEWVLIEEKSDDFDSWNPDKWGTDLWVTSRTKM